MSSRQSPSTKPAKLGQLSGADVEMRALAIYFIVLDRFHAGTPHKPRDHDELLDANHEEWGKYWGGDLQGVLDKLDYLHDLAIGAIWSTPLFDQVQELSKDQDPRAPIHGYWVQDYKRINARWVNDPSETRLFERDDTVFDRLLRSMRERKLKFILDVVCNHSSPRTSKGKGKLYDDGRLIADFDRDVKGWYHHEGEIENWDDPEEVQKGELAGLADFDENNIQFRNHLKDALRLWIAKGVDALRFDTVKHMPLWFWQELTADLNAVKPHLFQLGEWIYSDPRNKESVEFANSSGMTILDFGFCQAIRDCFSGREKGGFRVIQKILDYDKEYLSATELVTFFENHDMPRLQSLGVDDRGLELALVLLLTSRGIPCLYYGCEQYLHNDTEGGADPYNRPQMDRWGKTEAVRLIQILAKERQRNQALQWGGQWPVCVEKNTYAFVRRYRDSRCFVIVNTGPARSLELSDLECADGTYKCLLSKRNLTIQKGKASIALKDRDAMVFAVRGQRIRGKSIVRVQINGAPCQPGCRLLVIGDCPELGNWDLAKGYDLECVNSHTWFGEIPFTETAGEAVGFKYVILPAEGEPVRENCVVRRRAIPRRGPSKWRDYWER